MTRVQVIEIDGHKAYLVPADIWERVKEMVEDAEDAADYERAVAQDDGVRFPHEVAFAMLEGAHLVRAWREYRGMTLQALADAAGISKGCLSQIEVGKRTGTAATLKKLAAALGVPVGALVL
ncbi:helix-turn-helix transcriptional regulator [Thermoleptolyngbya sichuanensis XZ-Cy5]|nr:helix-turn-helix transcriptional regulator [Thermoleptolyngbya sichuanensis XZ-Cy5]